MMKSILQKLAVSFVLGGIVGVTTCAASPLIPLPGIGEEASIRGLLSASIAYNDNIYLADSDKNADTIFTISPGLEFTTGQNGRNTLTVRFVENLTYYMDETDNNRGLENFDLTYGHGADGDKMRLGVAAGFHHNQASSSRNSLTKGTMTRTYNYYGNAIVSYKLGDKTSLRTGAKWNGTTYENHRDEYNDREQYAVPLYLYYAVTTKLNVGLSAEYRYLDLASSGRNRAAGVTPGVQQVWFLGVSAEGDIWEKLSLNGRIGYTTSDYSRRTLDSVNKEDSLGMSISANYKATEKLSTALTLDRDFEVGGAAEGIISTGVSLRANYQINDFWGANAGFSYSLDDYQNSIREDDRYTFSLGASYAINEYTSAYANYSLSMDDSNLQGQDYTNNIVTVGISIRY